MFKDGVVVLIVGVIVLGAGAVWWTQTPKGYRGSTSVGPQVQEPETPSKTASASGKTAGIIPKPRAASVVEESSAGEAAASAKVSPSTPIVHPDPPPFPAVEQIVPGARMDSITGKYGQPALSTVTLTDGHLVETLIYSGNPSHSATIIRLEDGRVAAAYSRPEPVLPAGVSVPWRGSSN